MSPLVRNVRILFRKTAKKWNKNFFFGKFLGWGEDAEGLRFSYLQEFDLGAIPFRNCSQTYLNLNYDGLPNGINDYVQLCAGSYTNAVYMCAVSNRMTDSESNWCIWLAKLFVLNSWWCRWTTSNLSLIT